MITLNFDCDGFSIAATGTQFTSLLDENGRLWLVLSDYSGTQTNKAVLELIGCNFKVFEKSLAFDPDEVDGTWYIEA